MTLIFVVVAIAGVGLISLAAVRRVGQLDDPIHDRRIPQLPTGRLTATDLATLRFGVCLRGYRMAEVDEVLDRLGREIADRDALIGQLHSPAPPLPGS